MTDYLSIECVVSNLVSQKIITPKKDWKNTNPSTQKYFVTFYGESRPSTIVFQIIIKEGGHYISKTSFINHAHYLRIDNIVESVLGHCSMPKAENFYKE
jgi:hypothetical protein